MFVKQEKYNALKADLEAAMASLETLKAEMGEKDKALNDALTLVDDLTAQNDALKSSDLQKEVNSLKADLSLSQQQSAEKIAEMDATVLSLKTDNQNLKTQISENEATIADMQQTIDRLNNRGAATPAAAHSSGDGFTNDKDLISFYEENEDDTQACVERLRAEGF